MMAKILVVVCDRGRARFFGIDQDSDELVEMADLLNPTLRLHAHALAGERQGRSFNRIRGSRAGLGDDGIYKRLSTDRFAREVAEGLSAYAHHPGFTDVYLLAEPKFLGFLRPRLKAGKLPIPVHESSHNLTQLGPTDIRRHLPHRLWKRRIAGVRV